MSEHCSGLMGTKMVIVNENWSMPESEGNAHPGGRYGRNLLTYVVDDDQRLRCIDVPVEENDHNPSVSKVKHVMRKEPISVM